MLMDCHRKVLSAKIKKPLRMAQILKTENIFLFSSMLTSTKYLIASVALDVIVLKRVEFVGDVRGFVAQEFDVLLVAFEDVEGVFDVRQFGAHVALCIVDDAAQTGEGA
jgi:hypothetical protein